MKILNLYAGIGGNRKLWGNEHDITAIEINQSIANVYSDYFPNDKVIVDDAHNYLENNYNKFDFIWSSPPCQTHSRLSYLRAKSSSKKTGAHLYDPKYPDMTLYQEIIFLDLYFNGSWVVENVEPSYQPLIPGQKIDRHLYWANFKIGQISNGNDNIQNGTRKEWEEKYGYNLSKYSIDKRTDTVLRNCVHPKTGKHILDRAQDIYHKSNQEQTTLFND